MNPVVLSLQLEFAGGPLDGQCRHVMSGLAPKAMWFAPTPRRWSPKSEWVRVDFGDGLAPQPPWEGQIEYRLSAGPIGGVAIYGP